MRCCDDDLRPRRPSRAPSRRRAAAGILADLGIRGWGPKFVNVGRAQLNSQNFLQFSKPILTDSTTLLHPPGMISRKDGRNGGVDVKEGRRQCPLYPNSGRRFARSSCLLRARGRLSALQQKLSPIITENLATPARLAAASAGWPDTAR